MANSDVWINGIQLGHRPNGYVTFRYDLTDHLRADGDTILAVRTDTSQQVASRWYTGSGIYRHVRLIVSDAVHVEPWGVFVTTPEVSADRAVVAVTTTLVNEGDGARTVTLRTTVESPSGDLLATSDAPLIVEPGTSRTVEQSLAVDRPDRWEIDHPVLHAVHTEVLDGDRTIDQERTRFGIRHAEFRADTGFWLNGRNLKLKGVCVHHDGGAVGAAVPLDVWRRRFQRLKELGVNAIRTAHNPPSPEFLDLCDDMGILVMDEFFDCWTVRKRRFDYHLHFKEWSHRDLADAVRRDRNHPSVILYSVGNEIHDTPKPDLAKGILAGLVEVCHANDPTRPVTQGLFRPNVSHDYDNGLADMLDVIGTNYRDAELLKAWRDKPSRKIVGTEQRHELETWLHCRDNPQHSGQFLWVGIDYLGESPRWPVTTFNAGLIDRAGFVEPRGRQRQSWWAEIPMVAAFRRIARTPDAPVDPGYEVVEWDRRQVLFSDWNPDGASPGEQAVEVYSNCDAVELVLNGTSLGVREKPANDSPRTWKVPYAPGTLTAIGSNDGREVCRDELHTAGPPAAMHLAVDREQVAPDWDELAHVELTIVDAEGRRVPGADHGLTFTVDGPGRIVAVDNASIASHEPFQADHRSAFHGRCLVMLAATADTGSIRLTAAAEGLPEATVTLEAVPSATR